MKTSSFKMIICALILGFVSCGGNDDDPTTKKVTGVEYKFVYELSASILEVADITFTYLDEIGRSNTENITSERWSKVLAFTTFPAKVELNATYKLKSNLTKEKYDLSIFPKTYYTVKYSDGTKGREEIHGNASKASGVGKDKLDRFLTTYMSLLDQDMKFIKTSDDQDIVVE